MQRIAQELGLKSRTSARNWTIHLEAAGILAVNYRPKSRGGCQSNLLDINWRRVRETATHRAPENRAPNSVDRAPKIDHRAPNFGAPIEEYSSLSSSLVSNTTTTTALLHAPRDTGRSEEVEGFRQLVKECRAKFPESAQPRRLEEALRVALNNGCSLEQLWTRCRWWFANNRRWSEQHRAGVCYVGLKEATPDMAADRGWPYQH